MLDILRRNTSQIGEFDDVIGSHLCAPTGHTEQMVWTDLCLVCQFSDAHLHECRQHLDGEDYIFHKAPFLVTFEVTVNIIRYLSVNSQQFFCKFYSDDVIFN